MTDQPDPQGGQPAAKFDPNAPHMLKPKLRNVRGVPVPAQAPDGTQQTMLGLADAQQISVKMVATIPAVQAILPLFDGEHELDAIVSEVGRGLNREFLENLVAQLDDAGLLFGPTFDALLAEMRAEFDATDTLPPGATAAFADALAVQKHGQDEGVELSDEDKERLGAQELPGLLDQWIDAALEKAEKPSFDSLPKAVVAPHVDYPRGWINYASTWGRLRVVDRPTRVVILGTNHFGMGTGVTACDKGFRSPLGTCNVASDLVEALKGKLGEENSAKLFENRYDHEREHSIELQIPWLQHCLGADENGNYCDVFGVLVHDPAQNNGDSYDGQGLGLEPFVEAMKSALAELDGTTLVVASSDLSHVGPAFGDQQQLVAEGEGEAAQAAEAFRNKVAQHDREMLTHIAENRPADLVSSMAWQQNPTRWCSVGNLVAAMQIVEPGSVELLNYAAAVDPQGISMVSHASMVMT